MMLNSSLKSILRIARIELNSMFYSPVAWLVLIIFAVQVGIIYSGVVDGYIYNKIIGYKLSSISTGLFGGPDAVFLAMNKYLYLYFPLLTMGLMSKEYYSGSIKLLYSSPISNSSIIVGKFISMMVYSLALMSIIFFYFIFSAITVSNFEYQPVLSGILGIYLLMLAYSAIGLFMSTLTSYQVVAAIGTLALLAFFNFVGGVGQEIDFVRDLTYWISISGRNHSFISGLISSEDLLYFIIVIVFFIVLSVLKLKQERYKVSKIIILLRYVVATVATLLLGYVTSQPQMKVYADTTFNKRNTLSSESQKVMSKLDGAMTITTYVNVLDQDYYSGLPKSYKYDYKSFERYVRFNPKIKIKYVYYYHKVSNPGLKKRYPNKSDVEIAKIICKVNRLDFEEILTPTEINELVDLSGERYKFVRIVERENGQKAVLRLFNDNERHPGEAEISGALKRLTDKPVSVGFLIGHGERDINNYGEKGYYLFATDIWFRQALTNHGFDSHLVDLSKQDIPSDMDILVIADLKKPLEDSEMDKLTQYIDKGGNLFILGDYQRKEIMDKLTSQLGVTFSDGVLVNETKYFSPTVTINNINKMTDGTFPIYDRFRGYGYVITMPTAVALDYSKVTDYEVIPILSTAKEGSWIETETKDFIDGKFVVNSEAGEEEKSHVTMIALRRQVGDKQQRIMIVGDADFISNSELDMDRYGVYKANYAIITGAFRWFSDDRFPISTTRISRIDNELSLDRSLRKPVRILFLVIFPAILISLGLFIIIRRQRK